MSVRLQLLTGVSFLFLGALVYITDRPAAATIFVNRFAPEMSLYAGIPAIYGSVGYSFTSFAHTFSFSLITAGTFWEKQPDYKSICLFWAAINCLFEIGQKYSHIAIFLSPIDTMRSYFEHGTYDFFDMTAIAAGGLSAYVLLATIGKRS